MSNVTTLGAAVGVVAGAALAVITLAIMVGKPLRRLAQWLDDFREDWHGTAARAGRPPVPGVLERLAGIEKELRTNGGGTLRDAVNRLEQRFDDHLQTHQLPPGGQA